MNRIRPCLGLLFALCASCAAPPRPALHAVRGAAPEAAAPCVSDADCAVVTVRDVELADCCQPACVQEVVTAARAAVLAANFTSRCGGLAPGSCPLFDCPAPPRAIVATCAAGRCVAKPRP